jgi:hypothetical protein
MKIRKLIKNLYVRILFALVLLIVFVAVFTTGTPFVRQHSLALLIVFLVIVSLLDFGP